MLDSGGVEDIGEAARYRRLPRIDRLGVRGPDETRRRDQGIVAALPGDLNRLLRLFADDHAVHPHADRRFNAFTALTNLGTVFIDRPVRSLYLINFPIYLGLFGYFRMVLVYMVDRWHTTVDQTPLIYFPAWPSFRRSPFPMLGETATTDEILVMLELR